MNQLVDLSPWILTVVAPEAGPALGSIWKSPKKWLKVKSFADFPALYVPSEEIDTATVPAFLEGTTQDTMVEETKKAETCSLKPKKHVRL